MFCFGMKERNAVDINGVLMKNKTPFDPNIRQKDKLSI